MAQRRCGYCRLHGHVASACKTKADLVEVARRHTGRQRVELSRLLTANGFGIGALIHTYSYSAGENIPCIITQESLDGVALYVPMVEFNNVKYSKRASMRLHNYTGNGERFDNDDIYTFDRNSITIRVTPMQTGYSEITGYIHMSALKEGGNNNPARFMSPTAHSWDRYVELLAPSNEGTMTADAINRKFRIHDRLGGQWVEPILP